MTFPRDYTLAEIDAMRDALVSRLTVEGNFPTATYIEERLRTYMMAGVTLADLRGGVVKEPDMFGDEG